MAQVAEIPKQQEVSGAEEHTPRRSFFRRNPRAKFLFGAVALALVAGGILYWLHARAFEETDDAQIDGNVTSISARVGGTVLKVNVDDNQVVHAGDVLVQIDPRDYQIAIERAQADLADAQANAAAARTGIPVSSATFRSQLTMAQASEAAANKDVAAAQARLAAAVAAHDKAAADLKRYQQLVEKNEISRQQFDAAVAAEASSRASVDAARAGIAATESQVREAQGQVSSAATAPEQISISRSKAGSAQANVDAKQAALAQAQLNLDYATVKAPIDGIISRKAVQPGQILQPGQAMFAIVPVDDLWVVANFKENQLKDMRIGQAATIHVDAYNRDYNAHVNSFGGTTAARTSLLPPENATGNYVKVVQRIPVKILLDKGQDAEHLLRPGMSVVPKVRVR